jgi:hypothetical protein
VTTSAEKIKSLVKISDYEKAFSIGKYQLETDPSNKEIMADLRVLTGTLRSKCMGMACKKQDCTPAYLKLEKLLSRVSYLTDQDLYGNKL